MFNLLLFLLIAGGVYTRLKGTIHRVLANSDITAQATIQGSSSSMQVTSVGGRLRRTHLDRTGVHVRVRRVELGTFTTSSIGLTRRETHVSSLHRFAPKMPMIIRNSALFCLCAGHKKCAPLRQTRVVSTTVVRLNGQFALRPSSICVRDDSVMASLVCNGGIVTSFASRSKL